MEKAEFKALLALLEEDAQEYLTSISEPNEDAIALIWLGDEVFCLMSLFRLALFDLENEEPALELFMEDITFHGVPKGKRGLVEFPLLHRGSIATLKVPADFKEFFAAALEFSIANAVPYSGSSKVGKKAASESVEKGSSLRLDSIPSNVNWKSIPKHLSNAISQNIGPKEKPVFFISDATSWGGALVALEDRCLIIKSGLMGGFMAGSLGGSRVTTFYYRDINAVEYNSGFLSGVLEVLTASYNGSANRDFWRGTDKSRNADANDPWTLSNTLPLSKLAYQDAHELISQLREMIRDSKETKITLNNSGPVSIADELAKLADLKSQGVISEKDFQAAKAKLLK
jgi:hypothetical protein